MQVFVSHSSHDSDYVRQVVAILHRHLDVFLLENINAVLSRMCKSLMSI